MMYNHWAGCLSVLLVASTFAQPSATATATWQLSADNGGSWQSGALVVPASQVSVLARCVVSVDAANFPGASTPHFASAQFETYWTSVAGAGWSDAVADVQVVRTVATGARLTPVPSATNRFGSVLKTAGVSPTPQPLGMGPALLAVNEPTAFGGVPSRVSTLTVCQYRITLDGTAGDRTVAALWRGGFSSASGVTAGTGSVIVGQFVNASSPVAVAAPIVDLPVTLTVIPAPGVTALLAGGAMFAFRRRRV